MANPGHGCGMQPPSERHIDIGFGHVVAVAHGSGEAPHTLALHGWLDNAASFEPLGACWTTGTLWALELPGHGHASHLPAGLPYAMVDYVAVLDRVLRAFDWPSCALWGHSLGAGIAALYAGTAPARVHELVLIDGLGPLTTEANDAPQRLRGALEDASRHHRAPTYPDVASVDVRLARAQPQLTADARARLLRRGLQPVEGGVTWRTDPRLRHRSMLRLTEAHVQAFLGSITCPTLLVRANRGVLVPFDLTARVRAITTLTDVTLEGGHHVHMDAPQSVLDAVQRWQAARLTLKA